MKLNRIMIGIKCIVFFVFLASEGTPARTDTEVSCVFMKTCILPCSYEVDTDVVIHWHQVSAGDICVHSFYHNEDQLTRQDQRFRGRTSLFKGQLSRGNASLQLTAVMVQDMGQYKCYTSTANGNKESFIRLKLKAPVQLSEKELEELAVLIEEIAVGALSLVVVLLTFIQILGTVIYVVFYLFSFLVLICLGPCCVIIIVSCIKVLFFDCF